MLIGTYVCQCVSVHGSINDNIIDSVCKDTVLDKQVLFLAEAR